MSGQSTRQAQIRGTTLLWTEQGTGPVFVYAHGLTQNGRSMEDAGAYDLTPLTLDHKVIRVDARAHGGSSGHPEPVEYTWPELAQDLLAVIDEASPGSPVIGMGTSMGTASLLHLAVRAPERLRALILTAPPTAWETRATQTDGYLGAADLVEASGLAGYERLTKTFATPEVFAGNPGYPTPIDVDEALLPAVLRGAAHSDLPPAEQISALDIPVLMLAWEGDTGHPVSTAQRLDQLLPNCELHVATSTAEIAAWGQRIGDFVRAIE